MRMVRCGRGIGETGTYFGSSLQVPYRFLLRLSFQLSLRSFPLQDSQLLLTGEGTSCMQPVELQLQREYPAAPVGVRMWIAHCTCMW